MPTATAAAAPQVEPGQQQDNEQCNACFPAGEGRERGGHRRGGGAGADRDDQNIADDKRSARDNARPFAEVVEGDGIGAASLRIGVDRLAVADDEDDEQRDQRADDRKEVSEGRGAEHGKQDQQDLFPRIGDGGDCIVGKNGHSPKYRQPLIRKVRILERLSEEEIADAVFHGESSPIFHCHQFIKYTGRCQEFIKNREIDFSAYNMVSWTKSA